MSDNTKPPKLEQQIRDACRTRHYALATERAYVAWYKRFVRWAGLKHPATLGGDAVERWLSHLATEGEVSASTAVAIAIAQPIRTTPRLAVWSDGSLAIERGSEHMHFTVDESRQIVRYLERMAESEGSAAA